MRRISCFIHEIAEKAKKKYQVPISKKTGSWHSNFFPPDEQEVYTIDKWYADAKPKKTVFWSDDQIAEEVINEEDGLVGLELRIFLKPCDWYKFQDQAFYTELMQYLDNLKIQKEQESLDEVQD